MKSWTFRIAIGLLLATSGSAQQGFAAQARIDKDTCTQLVGEQATFIQSGILADLQRGAAWGKANLSSDRLREIEHYIMLDEQIKFGCRQATLTPEMEKAGEIAKRLEQNSDADPFAPPPEKDEAKTKAKDAAAPDSPKKDPPPNAAPETPVLKPKVERRAVRVEPTPLSDPSLLPPVKPAAKATAKPSTTSASTDDALKTPPAYVAPPPAQKP